MMASVTRIETPMCARCEHAFHEFICVDCNCEGLRKLSFGLRAHYLPVKTEDRKESKAA